MMKGSTFVLKTELANDWSEGSYITGTGTVVMGANNTFSEFLNPNGSICHPHSVDFKYGFLTEPYIFPAVSILSSVTAHTTL